LPNKHARHLYDSQKRARANILAQLRSGHSWLASHAKRIKNREDDKCECGARETISHVLVDCLKLCSAREKLRKRIGTRFNSRSLTLGGKHYRPLLEHTDWKITKKDLKAVLDFVEET
jgi:hypothetical protein